MTAKGQTDIKPRKWAYVQTAKCKTRQDHKEECDINVLMNQYVQTGSNAHFQLNTARYGFAEAADFQDVMMTIAAAKDAFLGLPAEIRERFGNDPATYLDYIDQTDEDTLIKEGLAEPREKPGEPENMPKVPESSPEAKTPESDSGVT